MHVMTFGPSKHRKKFLIGLFLLLVLPQTVLMGRHVNIFSATDENRTLAPFPAWPRNFSGLLEYPARVDKYVSDNFGLRDQFILLYEKVKFGLLGSSNEMVMVGKNGWLFQNGKRYRDDYVMQPTLEQSELRGWKVLLEERQDWLRQQGINFLVVLAPNKHTIYPEHLPVYFHVSGKQTAREQFTQYLKHSKSRLHFLDLAPFLLDAKTKGELLYHKTDTHWNFTGAYIGYRVITKALPGFFPAPVQLDESHSKNLERQSNLYKMLGLPYSEFVRVRQPKDGWRAKWLKPDTRYLKGFSKRGPMAVSTIPDGRLPSLLVLGDSFLGWDKKYFAEHFKRAVYVNFWGKQWKFSEAFPPDFIAAEKPNLVILQMKEDRLGSCSIPFCLAYSEKNTNAQDVRQARLKWLFGRVAPLEKNQVGINVSDSGSDYSVALSGSSFQTQGSGIYIAKVTLTVQGTGAELNAVETRGGDRCKRFREVQKLHISPGEQTVYFCLDMKNRAPSDLLFRITHGNSISLHDVQLRLHSDI